MKKLISFINRYCFTELTGIVAISLIYGAMSLFNPSDADAQSIYRDKIQYYDKDRKLQTIFLPQELNRGVVVTQQPKAEKPVVFTDRATAIDYYASQAAQEKGKGWSLDAARMYSTLAFLEHGTNTTTLDWMIDQYMKSGQVSELADVAADLKERNPSTDYVSWSKKLVDQVKGALFDGEFHDLKEFYDMQVPKKLEVAKAFAADKHTKIHTDIEWMGLYINVLKECVETKDYNKALDYAEQMFTIEKNEYSYNSLAGSFYNEKKYIEAEKIFKEGISKFSDSINLKLGLVNTFHYLGKKKEAEKLVEQIYGKDN